MKTLTDIKVNNLNHDAVIESWMTSNKIDGKIEWVDAVNGIAKCHGDVRNVTVYLKDNEDYDKVTCIEIASDSIKKIYNLIIEIEKQTSEEFID